MTKEINKWQMKKCFGQTARQRISVCPKADTDTWAELTTWVNASRPFLRKHHAQQFILDHFLPTLIEYTCNFFANSIQTMWLFCISVSNFQFSTSCRQIEIRFRAPTINCTFNFVHQVNNADLCLSVVKFRWYMHGS